VDTSTAAGDKQQRKLANDEGSDEEGGKGDGNGDESGGRATATDGEEEGEGGKGDGDEGGGRRRGNMARNNDDGLVPVVVQQAVLYSASASIDNVGEDKSTGRLLAYALRTDDVGNDQTTTTMTATSSCRRLILQRPLFLFLARRLGGVIHKIKSDY
jgi:hypothetical protein